MSQYMRYLQKKKNSIKVVKNVDGGSHSLAEQLKSPITF